MAITENTYTGNGSTTLYSFSFPYLEETDLKVTLDEVVTTAYSFANATTIEFDAAPGAGVLIRIYRETDIDDNKAEFYPGSSIRAQNLNDNFDQTLYAVQEIGNNTWDKITDTIDSSEVWASNDNQVATTEAIDDRIDAKIDTAITNDITSDGSGVTVTDNGNGTITLSIEPDSVDFDRIKDVDIITEAEQDAGSPAAADNNLFTSLAASKRFDTIVQTTTPVGSDWQVGKTWLQNDQDLTLSVWNGSTWLGVASGGTFTNLPKVVYVDSVNGNDANDGHRISSPKQTIKAAINQINADATYGDGSVVMVAPGVYQEVAPIDITKKDVSVIGQALRSCIIHPTSATEENSLFRVNSGSYIANLTFTGVKASGTRGNSTIDSDPTYGLPENQGWNVSFYPGALIYKSPYIQNCTNFSDSEINNASLTPHTPAGGAAQDTDSAMTGGGLLVDGSVVDAASPLRSMVADSYTHVGLDGPAVLVTNNGYAQLTSSYAFFCHYHIKTLNGGQANLAASTTDFGRYALVAQGRSQNAIFTATTTVLANDGDISFTIGAPTPGSPWHGTATRPQSNMLVDINGNTYPILSAVANGAGWDVTISRPNPSNRSENLGLDGAVAGGSAVSFYLRSMIASSGHTMEYVGSGTNYTALPENGGVPIEANQIVEVDDGKVWTAITDHNGKFRVGDFFEVNQQTGYVTIPSGSISFDLLSDLSPQLAADLDVNNFKIKFPEAPGHGGNYVALEGPSTVASNITWTLPAADGNAGEALTTDGAGALGWSSFLTSGDIGTTVQGYDADTAKYDDATANFTGTLQKSGSNVLVATDIGTSVQGYDADTAKLDVTQSFTAAQRGTISAIGNTSGTITLNFATANNFSLTLNANATNTLANPTNLTAGQSGCIYISQDGSGSKTLAYASNWDFAGGTVPTLSTAASAVDVLVYAVRTTGSIAAQLIKDVK